MIYESNFTNILWKAELNDSVNCPPKSLDLSNSGILSLKCEDGSIKWSKKNSKS